MARNDEMVGRRWEDNWQDDEVPGKNYFHEQEALQGDEKPIIVVDDDGNYYDSVIDISDKNPDRGDMRTHPAPVANGAMPRIESAPQKPVAKSDDSIGDEWLGGGSVMGDRHRMISEMAIREVRDAVKRRGLAGRAVGVGMGDGDVTIEEIVRDAVRPYLKTWVDHNLDSIVREVMRRELARLG